MSTTNRRWTAPAQESSKLDVPLIPADFQLCTLFGLIDMGTVVTNFGKKRQIKMLFEFPQHMAVFYEGDDPRPHSVIVTESFSMAPKSNLRNNYVKPMLGTAITDEQADAFPLSDLLGRHFVATIIHTADGQYANIDSIKPLTEANAKMFGLSSANVDRINDILDFHLNDGFEAESFKKLPKYFREAIANKSDEGIAHRAKGGRFAEPDKEGHGNSGSSNHNNLSAPPSASGSTKKLVMINKQYTYEQFAAQGWSDQMLVDKGEAKWEETAPQTPPMPQMPQGMPAMPSAPSIPTTPPSVPAPMLPPAQQEEEKPVLKMKDPEIDYAGMINIGWTDELLIQHGHATFVSSIDGSPWKGDDLPF